jgi:drug/metabolite transporter (DMT)-like permease
MHGDIPTHSEIGGALLAVAGITLILVPNMSFAGDMPIHHLTGNVFAMCAAGLTAFYACMYRILAERGAAPETMGVSLLTFTSGSVILALMVGLAPAPSGWDSLNGHALLVFLGLGVFPRPFQQ